MKPGGRWYDIFFILLFFYLFFLQIQAIWLFTIDDMYIPLRYAKHWVAGVGLLWNPNTPPVEGYSNFSFVVLGALTLILKNDPVFVLKTAGVIGLFFTCNYIYLISRFWFERRVSLIPCIGLLLYKGQIVWAVSGLETTVYQAFICAAVYYIFRGSGYHFFPDSRGGIRKKALIIAGLLLSFAGMTRPEAPVLMVLFFLLMCWDRLRTTKNEFWLGITYFMIPIGLIYLPYFLWRLHYFGHLLPNTIYCKGFNNHNTVLDINYLKLVWPFVLLAFIACIKKNDKRYYYLWLPSVLYFLMLIGSDTVAASFNRLFLPAFVLLLPLSLKGLSELILMHLKKKDETYHWALSLGSACVALLFIPASNLDGYRYFSNNPVKGEQARLQVLQWLNANSKKGDSVVLGDAGYIPYLSNLNFIDSYCLNNAAMTQYPKKKMYELFCQDILLQKPDVIILASIIQQDRITYMASDACLYKLLSNQISYKSAKTFSTLNQGIKYQYELYKNF